jgi:HAD superfamily hydrolase (TIGR01662 family)
MIKLIIFDLWNTLQHKDRKIGTIEWFWAKFARKHPYKKVLKIYERIFQEDRSEDFVKKYKKLFDELHLKKDKKVIKKVAWYRKKIESNGVLYKYVIPLMKKLKKKKYKIAILSNITYMQGKKIKKKAVSHYVNHFFFSCDLGSIKPNPKNFRTVMKYFKVKPSETLMIGDNYDDDYKPAKKLGIKAIHFESGSKLKRKLKEMKIL